jgi:hypothetical protein
MHITRKKNWSSEDGPDISVEEWLKYVEEDAELTLRHDFNGDYHAIWNGPSADPEPWIDWSDGELYSKYPDDPLVDKMVEIAAKLNARVMGDDGEVYTGGGAKNFTPPAAPPTSAPPQPKSWLHRFIGDIRPRKQQ